MYGDGASRNIYVVSSTYTSLDIKNNIIVNANTSGTPLYFAGTTTPFTSNYNCLYSPSNIGYYSSAIYDLLTWQQTTGQDRSSISVYPSFIDTSLSLELNDYALFNCLKVPGVDRDINDSVRYNVTSMGCYTRELPQVDAALTEILHWDYSTLFAGDSSEMLQVILINYGFSDITSASIKWTFNQVKQSPISWNGNLSTGESDTIDLGVVHYIGGYNELAVFIDALGTLSDTIPMNDTVRV